MCASNPVRGEISEMGEKRHFHVSSTSVRADDRMVEKRHSHVPSTLIHSTANYDHIVAVLMERIRRSEREAELESYTPEDELRLKASGMAWQRVGNISFYRERAQT